MAQYMMMIYAPTDPSLADADGTDVQRWIELDQRLKASGLHVADHRLHDVSTARTVRVREGRTAVTDGPVAPTPEYLSGYYLLEADDVEDVVRVAADVPLVHYGSVEVRPVMAGSPS